MCDLSGEPFQHEECGKLLCKECLEEYGRDKPCPHCRTGSQYYKDNKSERLFQCLLAEFTTSLGKRSIQALAVKCANMEKGCEWRGTIDTVETHITTCEFSLKKILPCSNAGCDKKMEHQQLVEHVRTECPHTVMACKYKGIGCATELKRNKMSKRVLAHGEQFTPINDSSVEGFACHGNVCSGSEHARQDCGFCQLQKV